MLIFYILVSLLTLVTASPTRHKDIERGEPERWDVVPKSRWGCWEFYTHPQPPDKWVNWTAMSEASNMLKEWGVTHKVKGGNLHGYNVGK